MVALYLVQHPPSRRPAFLTAGLAIGATALGAVLGSVPGATYYRVDTHPSRLCRGAPVSVCLLAGNTSQLTSWTVLMNQAADRLRGAGLGYPPRYEQPTPHEHSLAVGVIFFDPGTINIKPPSHLYVAESLATPAGCPAYATDQPPAQGLNAREWLAQLIVDRVWPDDPSTRDRRVRQWEQATPRTEQNRWARTTFAGLRACALTQVDVPVGR